MRTLRASELVPAGFTVEKVEFDAGAGCRVDQGVGGFLSMSSLRRDGSPCSQSISA